MPRGGKRPGAGRKKADHNREGSSQSNNPNPSHQATSNNLQGTNADHGRDQSIQGDLWSQSQIKEANQDEPKEITEFHGSIQEGTQARRGETELGAKAGHASNQEYRTKKLARVSGVIESMAKDVAGESTVGPRVHVPSRAGLHEGSGQVRSEQTHPQSEAARGRDDQANGGAYASSHSNPHATSVITREQIERLRDPVYFARAFCLQSLDEWQARFLADARTPGRSALRGANGIGKTVIIAVLILFFLSTVKNCRVVVVSGVFRQLKMMVDHLSSLLKNFPGWQVLRGSHELISPFPSNKAVWFSTDSPGAAEGQHSVVSAVSHEDHTLNGLNDAISQARAEKSCLILIRDECKTIPDRVKEATDTFGADWTFDMSNPGSSSGWFYEIFSRLGHIYRLHHVTAQMSSFLTPQYIAEFEQIHPKESARYKNAIEAEFSDAGLKNILTMAHWDNCMQNPPPWMHSNVNVGGLDLSAAKKGGDECILYWRKGNQFQEPVVFTGYKNESDLVTDVLMALKKHNITEVFADNGGMGSTMISFMEKALIGTVITIRRVDFGGKCISTIQHNYKSRGTEMYFAFAEGVQMRKWILPKDPKTRSQIISRETETFGDGMIRLVPKSDLPDSPDRADAIVLCAQEVPQGKGFRTFEWDDNEKGGRISSPEFAKTVDGFDLGM